MVEPFSVGALGMLAATEGIRFLYGQATQVLQRWRDRNAGGQAEAEAPIAVPEADASAVLEGHLEPRTLDFEALERLHDDIEALADVLDDLAGGRTEPDPADADLAAAADGLRRALEAVYRQHITFRGEQRPSSGPAVFGRAEVDTVVGELTVVRARLVRRGRITAEFKGGTVEGGGKVDVVDIDTLG